MKKQLLENFIKQLAKNGFQNVTNEYLIEKRGYSKRDLKRVIASGLLTKMMAPGFFEIV